MSLVSVCVCVARFRVQLSMIDSAFWGFYTRVFNEPLTTVKFIFLFSSLSFPFSRIPPVKGIAFALLGRLYPGIVSDVEGCVHGPPESLSVVDPKATITTYRACRMRSKKLPRLLVIRFNIHTEWEHSNLFCKCWNISSSVVAMSLAFAEWQFVFSKESLI